MPEVMMIDVFALFIVYAFISAVFGAFVFQNETKFSKKPTKYRLLLTIILSMFWFISIPVLLVVYAFKSIYKYWTNLPDN